MSETVKGRIKYVIPSTVTLLLYSIVLMVKGIYPFGSNTIDYYDMAQQIAAFYYHVYDMLHGTKSFFYDFYTALGVNMAMSTSGCSNLSLFNLFFLFIKRESLLNSLSVFHGIKIAVMSFTMYFYVDKTYRNAPYYFKLVSSVGYAFCGFVLVLYITNQWVDIAAIFPLIMYYYNRMIETGKIKGYVITLSLALIASYYLGFMILIFVFLYTGILMSADRIFEEKEDRKNLHILELGIGTVISLLISMFTLIPQITQMMSSARFKNGSEKSGLIANYFEIISHVKGEYTTRWWTLLLVGLMSAVILIGIVKNRKDKKDIFISVSLVLMMILELFFESINLIWHFGSYVQYPIRNGFIIAFVFAILSCHYAEYLFDSEFKYLGFTSIVFTVVGFITFIVLYNNHTGMTLRSVFHMTSAMMAVCFAIYIFLLVYKNGEFYSFSVGIICFEILCYSFLLYGQPDFITGYSEEPEQEGEYIRICNQLNEAFSLEPEFLLRTKNPDESLNANYGLVLRQPELSNWTHMIAPNEQKSAADWGYSIQFTRLLDSGGTVFSDALLGVRNVISSVPLDDKLYTKIQSANIEVDHITGEEREYTLYKPKYILPWGIILNSSYIEIKDDSDMVELHNQVYKAMASSEDSIAEWLVKDNAAVSSGCDASIATDADDLREFVSILKIKGSTAVYVSGSGGDNEYANCTIKVKDSSGERTIGIPTLKNPDNELYPAHFNNNNVYIGCYENESVEISVSMDKTLGETFDVDICGVDIEKLENICDLYAETEDENRVAARNRLNIGINSDYDNGILIIPLTYDTGWSTHVNGDERGTYPHAGLFTAIPVDKGLNNVSMKFVPNGMKQGIVITAITILLVAAYIVCSYIKKSYIELLADIMNNITCKWIDSMYLILFIIAVLGVYIIPIIGGIVSIFV